MLRKMAPSGETKGGVQTSLAVVTGDPQIPQACAREKVKELGRSKAAEPASEGRNEVAESAPEAGEKLTGNRGLNRTFVVRHTLLWQRPLGAGGGASLGGGIGPPLGGPKGGRV